MFNLKRKTVVGILSAHLELVHTLRRHATEQADIAEKKRFAADVLYAESKDAEREASGGAKIAAKIEALLVAN